MSKITGKGLVEFAKSKLGTPYVYGTKGEILNLGKINSLARDYPSIFTSSYIAKAKKYIGKHCVDCSGLISWYTGKLLGSSGLYAQAKERYPISKIADAPIGAILWRSGHVGIYIGDGYLIEAKGINYGTIKSKVSSCSFTHILIMGYIDYGNGTEELKGKNTWVKQLQAEINRTNRKVNLVEDGIAGPKTLNACPLLKRGSTGKVVKILQKRLANLGYYKYEPTSKFGKGTEAAVKRFQKAKGITADGIVGTGTWRKLLGL